MPPRSLWLTNGQACLLSIRQRCYAIGGSVKIACAMAGVGRRRAAPNRGGPLRPVCLGGSGALTSYLHGGYYAGDLAAEIIAMQDWAFDEAPGVVRSLLERLRRD